MLLLQEYVPLSAQWIVGGLVVAIVGLAGYIVRMHGSDRADRKTASDQLLALVERNIVAHQEHTASLNAQTQAINRILTEFARKRGSAVS